MASNKHCERKQLTLFQVDHVYIDEEIEQLGFEYFNEKLYKSGYIYIIWDEKFRMCGICVFKLGMGYGTDMDKRISVYSKGSQLLWIWTVVDPMFVEHELHRRFAKLFYRDNKWGNEYYAGSPIAMHNVVEQFLAEHREYSLLPYPEALATRINPVMKFNDAWAITYPAMGPRTKAAHDEAVISDMKETAEIARTKKNAVKSAGKSVSKKSDSNNKCKNGDSKNENNNESTVNDNTNNENNNGSVNDSTIEPSHAETIQQTISDLELDTFTKAHLRKINDGRRRYVLFMFGNLRDCVASYFIDIHNTKNAQSNRQTFDKSTETKYRMIVKCNIDNETKYGMLVEHGTKVSAKFPEVFNCEFTCIFGSFPRSIKAVSSADINNIHLFDGTEIVYGSHGADKPIFVQLPRYRLVNDADGLRRYYDMIDVVAMNDDDHTNIISIFNSFNNAESVAEINRLTSERYETHIRNRPTYMKELYIELHPGTTMFNADDISKLDDEISEHIQTTDIPTDISFDRVDENGFRLTIEPNNECVSQMPIELHDLLSDISDPKTEYKKSISLTKYITYTVEYIHKNKIAKKAFNLLNKSDLVKCKLLMKASIHNGKHGKEDCHFATILSITLIGVSNNSTATINMNSVNEYIKNNYGPIETRLRLTPGQSEKYETNKSNNPAIEYNIFAHNLKKKWYRRHEYYDMTITPTNRKIPPFRPSK